MTRHCTGPARPGGTVRVLQKPVGAGPASECRSVIPPMASNADDMIAALDAFVADPTDASTVGDL
jgi:hypothetical protein